MNNTFSDIIGNIAEIIECYPIEYACHPLAGQRILQQNNNESSSPLGKIGHSHTFYQYVCVQEAKNSYITINSQKYPLVAGMVCMIKPGTLHTISADGEYSIRMIEFKFNPISDNVRKAIDQFPDIAYDTEGKVAQILSQLITEYRDKAYNDCMTDIKIAELIVTLSRICSHDTSISISKANIYENKQKLFIPVLDYITENFAQDISIETLAKIAHMEKGYFTKQFKKCFDITPGSYVQAVRLSRALNMLEYADKSVEAIGAEVGFANVNSFIRAFKAKYNKTPKEYRNAIKIDMAQKYKE